MDEVMIKLQLRMYSLVAMIFVNTARIEGMKITNKITKPPFYGEESFLAIQQDLEEIAIDLKSIGREI